MNQSITDMLASFLTLLTATVEVDGESEHHRHAGVLPQAADSHCGGGWTVNQSITDMLASFLTLLTATVEVDREPEHHGHAGVLPHAADGYYRGGRHSHVRHQHLGPVRSVF